jgi:hypothetical protein
LAGFVFDEPENVSGDYADGSIERETGTFHFQEVAPLRRRRIPATIPEDAGWGT